LQQDLLKKRIAYETKVLKRVNDARIVKLLEVVELQRHVWIIMEYMGGKDLNQHVLRQGRLEEPEAMHLFREVVRGILACHKFRVLHRDIKLENILLDESKTTPKI